MQMQNQCWCKVRDVLFAETGFNLRLAEACPEGLKPGMGVSLVTLDSRGKAVRHEPLLDENQWASERQTFVHLTPYSDEHKGKARRLITIFVRALQARKLARKEGARNMEERFNLFAVEAAHGLVDAAYAACKDDEARIDALGALYGRWRVVGAMLDRGGLAELGRLDPHRIAEEIL